MNKKIPFPLAILTIFLVIIVIIVAAFLLCPEGKKVLLQDESGKTELDIVSTTTRTETDYGQDTSTEDWQTYRNEEYGFEIKYPLDFIEQKTKSDNALLNITKEDRCSLYVTISVRKNYDVNNILSSIGEAEKINVDDHLGYDYFYVEGVGISRVRLIQLEQDALSINFDCIGDGRSFATDNDKKTYLETFSNQILSTFRFAEPGEACVDNCGNGICEEIVCMATGCPCAETEESCPQDCGTKTEPENIQLEIEDFTTDKKTYTSDEELKASLTVLSSGEIEDVLIKLTGIKPYSYAYINSSRTVDLIPGENEIIFTATTPHCTSGCGGVYPGPYDLNIEIFINENSIASSTISIKLTSD